MFKLSVIETWVGTPMKMTKKYVWELHISMQEYSGTLKSACVYNSPEEAIEDYKTICGCDDFLGSIHLTE